jgi:hypothetical protein
MGTVIGSRGDLAFVNMRKSVAFVIELAIRKEEVLRNSDLSCSTEAKR